MSNWKNTGIEIATQAAALTGLVASGLPTKFNPQSKPLKVLKNGTLYTVANEISEKVLTGQSKLFDMPTGANEALANDIVYYGALDYVVSELGVDDVLYDFISDVSPLPDSVNRVLAPASIIVGSKMTVRIMDVNDGDNPLTNWILRPVSSVLKLVS
jgi:hypothetical protein